jgi:hypothetical protein
VIGREKKPEPSSRRYFIHFDKIGRKTGVSLRRKRKGELRRTSYPLVLFRGHGTNSPNTDHQPRFLIKSTRQHRCNHIAVNNLPLAGSSPDVLEVTVTLGQTVEGVVRLAAGTDEAAERIGLALAGVAAVLVNLANGELDRGVVVGLDDAVGGAALAGHVEIDDLSLLVLHFG